MREGNPIAVERAGVLVVLVRPEEPLFFANAERALVGERTLLDTRRCAGPGAESGREATTACCGARPALPA